MKKKMQWLLCTLLFLTTVLAACSEKSDNTATATTSGTAASQSPAQTAQAAKVIPITFFADKLATIKDLKTNTFSQFIEKKFNVDITWDLTTEMATKKPLVLASGDYPAVFFHTGLTKAEQMQYGQNGVFIPLNDLIDKYGPNIKNAMGKVPNLKASITAPDGNIYALPQIGECLFCYYAQKYWIDTAWLKNLGLKMPTTTDEFYQVLKAFKDQDPNKNGKKDEIPLSGATTGWYAGIIGFIMNAFIYDDEQSFLQQTNGKVDLVANKPEWKKGLEYIHKLYSEGLIDKESFTQTTDARSKKINTKSGTTVGVVSEGAYNNFTIIKDGETLYKDYDAVPPLTGPDGVKLTAYFGDIVFSNFAITNKATNDQKIAAIKIADYLYSKEGTIFSQYGSQQEYWKDAKTGDKDFNGKQAAIKFDNASLISAGATQNATWTNFGIYYMSNELKESDVAPADLYAMDASQIRLTMETKNKYVGFEPKELPPSSIFVATDQADTFNQLKVQINSYIGSSAIQFILGQKDLNKDWDGYVKGLDNLNLAKYLQIIQNAATKK